MRELNVDMFLDNLKHPESYTANLSKEEVIKRKFFHIVFEMTSLQDAVMYSSNDYEDMLHDFDRLITEAEKRLDTIQRLPAMLSNCERVKKNKKRLL